MVVLKPVCQLLNVNCVLMLRMLPRAAGLLWFPDPPNNIAGVDGRAANARGPGGPTGPLGTAPRTPFDPLQIGESCRKRARTSAGTFGSTARATAAHGVITPGVRGRLFATVEAKNVHGMPLLEGGAAGGHGALPGGPRGRLHRGAGRRAPPAVTSLAALADVADVTG